MEFLGFYTCRKRVPLFLIYNIITEKSIIQLDHGGGTNSATATRTLIFFSPCNFFYYFLVPFHYFVKIFSLHKTPPFLSIPKKHCQSP